MVLNHPKILPLTVKITTLWIGSSPIVTVPSGESKGRVSPKRDDLPLSIVSPI